jgi:hypothetical protein
MEHMFDYSGMPQKVQEKRMVLYEFCKCSCLQLDPALNVDYNTRVRKGLIEKGSENADLYLSVRKLRFSL